MATGMLGPFSIQFIVRIQSSVLMKKSRKFKGEMETITNKDPWALMISSMTFANSDGDHLQS